MGIPVYDVMVHLDESATCHGNDSMTLLVAPSSATALDPYLSSGVLAASLTFELIAEHRQHLGLDDLDFGEDGVWPTLSRVIGRRGLKVWRVSKACS